MFRLSLSLTKCKSALDNFSWCTNVGPISKIITSHPVHGGRPMSSLMGGLFNSSEVRGKVTTNLSSLSLNGGQYQPLRHGSKYVVNTLSVKWYRRRRKALEQRLKVLRPSTPVIEQRTPLPLTNEGRYSPSLFEAPEVKDLVKEEEEVKGIVAEINRLAEGNGLGRLFAVINLKGKQFKVTPEDIIIVQGYWAPDIGDRLRLHKVLLVGGSDFTLVGRPLIDTNLIRVEGTVIEKTMSFTKLHFRLKKRKNFRRLKFYKDPYTMLRINMIELNSL